MSDAGVTRLLAEIDRDKDRDCRACGQYPAVLGGLCGYCRGKDLASRSGTLPAVPRTFTDERRER